MSVFRIYVEKRKDFAVEAGHLMGDLKDFLGISRLENLRILNRYDVEGISREVFEKCIPTIFSEPQVDKIYAELPDAGAAKVFAVEYLPGQYDQRADSCAQCIQMAAMTDRPQVKTARIYIAEGPLTDEDLAAIKKYVINPVESREASLETVETLAMDYEVPPMVKTMDGFIKMDEAALSEFLGEYGLAMDLGDLKFCQAYFQSEDRDPTLTEIRMVDTYWSDHCRHTTFSTIIDEIEFEDEAVKGAYDRYVAMRKMLGREHKPQTLMDLATIGAKYLKHQGLLNSLDESEEINACSVHVEIDVDGKKEPWLLQFKNETHNHPTEIEPFGGAATCIGGAIRDPLAGRAYVYQAMRVTGAGNPLAPMSETLEGKLPQHKLVTTAAAGYSSYGNQIGLATGLVDEIYHPGYLAKRMEIGAVVGAVPEDHVNRQKPTPGDVIVLLGGKTGRDGCGGATGSSKSHDVSSLEECGAEVQKGNAPEERKLQRLFRKGEVTRLIKRCNDFGAGGVSVAIGELAEGLEIQLDAVPKKYEGLDGTELAISESQERMAVVVAAADLDEFLGYAAEENLEATPVARVTELPRLKMTWRNTQIVDLSREFLDSNGAEKHIKVKVAASGTWAPETDKSSLKEHLTALAQDLNICSKKGLSERFDASIGANTVLMPFGGKYQMTPTQAMAAKLPVLHGESDDCSIMAYGYNPYLTEASPYHGSYLAVAESVAKVVAAGGSRKACWLSFQEYFEKLGTDAQRWGKPLAALLGALDAQVNLEAGAIGGKDSMSGSFESIHVPPTLVSFAVSMSKGEQVISPEFKKTGSRVVLLTPVIDDKNLPDGESLRSILDLAEALIKDKKVLSAYVPGFGGLSEALFKMSLGNKIGFELHPDVPKERLFDCPRASLILELTEDMDIGEWIGTTTEAFTLTAGDETICLEEIQKPYEEKLQPVYPYGKENDAETDGFKFEVHHWQRPRQGASKPKVFIPVFPGTNCEYDTARALERAGADPQIFVIRNLTKDAIQESLEEGAKLLSQSQIMVIPGGFSGGDEPDGSGKFITAFFRNPRMADCVHELLFNRDGLILGICNGFQALIKLGLVPFGRIVDMGKECPTLTFNEIGRHQSMLVRTRIASNKSPWLMSSEPGDIHTIPISHGEGRFVAPEAILNEMARHGQIATQYVDLNGNPTMDGRYNPNGSIYAIEGITSPDGRVLGKMGHSERRSNNTYKNVEGNTDQKLFENAVRYFSL